MRFGQNPFKVTEKKIEPPAKITVGVLNYIPEQTGYFQNQFDAFKLCLASIREHADQPFDLLVVDNGSCPEVRDYLAAELEMGHIEYLIFNQRNFGKANAQMQILRSSPGDLIFYSDGDIYYRPGWMQAHLDVLNAFPEAGMVGGIPLRNLADSHTASTRHWAEKERGDLILEKGDLIPEKWTLEFLRSVGDERFIETWIHNEDWRVTRNNIIAYIGASHMQFLIPRRAIEKIPHRRFNLALHTSEDKYLDSTIEEAGFLRLSTAWQTVYHIGNRITEDWLIEEYHRLVRESSPISMQTQVLQQRNAKTRRHWFWGRWRVRHALKSMYEWAFQVYYENL